MLRGCFTCVPVHPDDERMSTSQRTALESKIQLLEAEVDRLKSLSPQSVEVKQKISHNDSNLGQVLKKQIEDGFKRRETDFAKEVFARYSEKQDVAQLVILKEKLPLALSELDIELTSKEAEELFGEVDTENSIGLTLDEFLLLLRKQGWAQSLPVCELVADALPRRKGIDPLRVVAGLSQEDITCMCQSVAQGLERLISKSSRDLKRAFDASDMRKEVQGDSKFNIVALSCGKIEDFHKTLESRIGNPNLKFRRGMETEHCSRFDSDRTFTTSNYRVTTTPRKEWIIVFEQNVTEADMQNNRVIPQLSKLMEADITKRAKLAEYEVGAVVLYTGPMFQIYNTVLRQFPKEDYMSLVGGGNKYSTTIYVLVSAVHKIAREVKLPAGARLYRGLGGDRTMPAHFYKSDGKGCRGMVEWGFMSTTLNKDVAVHYCGIKDGKPYPSIFEVCPGAVDRGAIITDFSQYPGERECLFPPCSFLEPQGTEGVEVTEEGVVCKTLVRLNVNLKVATCEELLGRKKQMHLSSFEFLLGELEKDLQELGATEEAVARCTVDFDCRIPYFISDIMDQCRRVWTAHQRLKAEEYLDDDRYRSLVVESLEVRDMGAHKFDLWLKGSEEAALVGKRDLRTCHREWTVMRERLLATLEGDRRAQTALEICRSKGLVRADVASKDSFGEAPLLTAAADGLGRAALELLVEARASVSAIGQSGETALHLAARFGRLESLAALAALGTDVSAEDHASLTPLHDAAQHGHVAAVEALVALRADPVAVDNRDRTPLHLAAQGGHLPVIEALAALGVDVRRPPAAEAVHLAARFGRVEAIRALVRLGADVRLAAQGSGYTPMHYAAIGGYPNAIEFLAAAGADVNPKAADGSTPLSEAVRCECRAAEEALRRLGAA